MPPTGVFSSWLHVGDEVAADLLDPAGLGAVLDQQQHVRGCPAARRARRPTSRPRPSGPRGSSRSVSRIRRRGVRRGPARPARRRVSRRDRGPGRGVRRRAGLDDRVGVVHDDGAATAARRARRATPGGSAGSGAGSGRCAARARRGGRDRRRRRRAPRRRRPPGPPQPSRPQRQRTHGYGGFRHAESTPHRLPLMFTCGPGLVHPAGRLRGDRLAAACPSMCVTS